MRKRSSRPAKIFFTAIIFVFFFGFLELVFRVNYTPGKITYAGIFEYDPHKVYRLKKNHNGSFEGKPVVTNSFGHRDSEIPIKKEKNEVRVLAVGDSILFGHGVNGNDTFTERLQHKLNENYHGKHFEVINTGVPGNSPFQSYFDLKAGLDLEPDIAIFQFTLNDVIEPFLVFRRYGGKGIDYHGVSDISYVKYKLKEHCAIYHFLEDMATRIKFKRKQDRKEILSRQEIYSTYNLVFKPDLPEILNAWREFLYWSQEMVNLAQDNGVKVVVLMSPFKFQFKLEPEQAFPQIKMRRFAGINAAGYLDLLNELQSNFIRESGLAAVKHENSGEPVGEEVIVTEEMLDEFWRNYFLDYDHYNEQGHQLVAELLYPLITKMLELESAEG